MDHHQQSDASRPFQQQNPVSGGASGEITLRQFTVTDASSLVMFRSNTESD